MRFWQELKLCVALHRNGSTMSRYAGQLLVGIKNQRDSTMALPICKSYLTSDFLSQATNLIFSPFVFHFPPEFGGFPGLLP